MVYVDRNGQHLESVDLNLGYLVDKEWIDHPAQAQKGHYEYARNASGGVVQTYVVDRHAQSAYREVTVQMFIPFEIPAVMTRASKIPSDALVLKGV